MACTLFNSRPAGVGLALSAPLYFTPPPMALAISACCRRAFSSASSMLKLAGFCRGGDCSNVLKESPTDCFVRPRQEQRSGGHLFGNNRSALAPPPEGAPRPVH